jgi:hypothetical protein
MRLGKLPGFLLLLPGADRTKDRMRKGAYYYPAI